MTYTFEELTTCVPFAKKRYRRYGIKITKTIPTRIRTEIYLRSTYHCEICNSTAKIIHHIIPNGPSTIKNLIHICRNCHYCLHWLLRIKKGY
jgi:5-methylcytosine-specific restriction endonuclease McrA